MRKNVALQLVLVLPKGGEKWKVKQILKHTALHDFHKESGAKLAPFAGFDMPLYYRSGALKEHLFCREQAAAGTFYIAFLAFLA